MSDEEQMKLTSCCQILSAYLVRPNENKVQDVEWEVIKTVCEYLKKHLK